MRGDLVNRRVFLGRAAAAAGVSVLPIGRWEAIRVFIFNAAMDAHLADPLRFTRGPAESSVWGWLWKNVTGSPGL